MMSSEEDVTVDSFGLPKKTKRSRQRVDAGEPRNSYSSIPNFSSRPNLLNAGIYGTFFGAAAAAIQQNHQQQQFFNAHQQQQQQQQHNQNQQQPGFGPSKMLNDLIARSIKTINPSLDRHQLHSHHPLNHHSPHRMMTVEPVGPAAAADISIMSYEQQQQQTSSSTTTSLADMATHHMLRNILQSRNKKELFALEQELRAVSAAAAAVNPTANDGNEASNLAVTGNYNNNNNNYYRNNNNNNNNNNNSNNNLNKIGSNNNDERLKSANFAENGVSEASSVVLDGGAADERRSLVNGELDDEPEENEEDEEMDVGNEEDCQASTKVSPAAPMLQEESNCNKSSDELESDSEIPSPQSKDDGNNNIANGASCKEDGNGSIAAAAVVGEKQQQQVADSTELKKARVENIVSGMRSSPSHVVQVNGCKKRKLYHPQQHDNKDNSRDKTIEDNLLLSEEEDEEEEEEEEEEADEEEPNLSPNVEEIREKVAEKNALKHQLRTMQEKLKEMQHRYNQLQKSHEDSAAVDDGNDMTIAADEDEEDLEERSDRQSPLAKEARCVSATTPTTVNLNPIGIGKMLSSSKLLPTQQQSPVTQQQAPQTAAANIAHQMNLHPGTFNGTAALSFLQHQMFQEQQAVHHHPSASLNHHHLNAARHNPATLGNAAAAMYLGVSQKLLLEQEARLAKEAALMAAEHQFAQNHHHRNYHHPNVHRRQQQQQQQQQQQLHDGQHSADVTSQHAQPQAQQQQQREQSPNCKVRHRQSNSPALFSSEEKLKIAVNSNTTDLLLGFVDTLKSRIPLIVPNLIEEILAQYLEEQQQLRPTSSVGKSENETKDGGSGATAGTILDRKSPRTKVIDRGNNVNGANSTADKTSTTSKHHHCSSESNNNVLLRPSPPATNSYHQSLPVLPSKMMSNGIGLYPSMNNLTAAASHLNPFCLSEMRDSANVPEQNEALSLVVMPKKKRHKVTDTRITPRTVNRILSQDNNCPAASSTSTASLLESPSKYGNLMASMNLNNGSSDSPPPPPPPPPPPIPRSYHLPVVPPVSAPVLPVSLPTSVAIPNPGLHESQVFSPYTSFYATGQHLPTSSHHMSGSSRTTSPTNAIAPINDHLRSAADSPPPPPSLPHHSAALFHPALLAAAAAQQQHHHQQQQQQQQQQQPHSSSPDYLNMRSNSGGGLGCGTDSIDRTSDCNSVDGGPFDAMTPILSTLTPMHLRKAKLMFFWVRYPSSAVLKTYFPDIRFNKGNTAQLVKWFSNFREFYYIQMEKYARQAVAEEKSIEDLVVSRDDEIYRVLNLHYNRNNHIEVPPNFRYVIEQTLKEFYKAILTKKDAEQSWKKAIYKVISRLDDPVPEYFKSPNFLEQLE